MEFLVERLEEMPGIVSTLIVAALPISELRGAIPYAVCKLKMSYGEAFALGVIGNLLPVPALLFFLEGLSRWLSRVPLFARFFRWWFGRVERRRYLVEKYGALGLVFFVAIPLPVTGAWTGSVAAILFKKNFKAAFPAIALGVVIAGIVVTTLTFLVDVGFLREGGIFLKEIQ